jgi:hypothetical protein
MAPPFKFTVSLKFLASTGEKMVWCYEKREGHGFTFRVLVARKDIIANSVMLGLAPHHRKEDSVLKLKF